MEQNKYAIRYLPTFITQFNNILYHITYELNNKIAADNFYKEVVSKIEKRSIAPTSFEVFKKSKKEKINWLVIPHFQILIIFILFIMILINIILLIITQ